jgi:RNA polymerase sigma-70 factor (ECF subfamily)
MTAASDPPPAADDASTLAALRAGDERAFTELVERYHPSMVRLAMAYVPSYAVAEEAAQEAWLGVLNGLHRFEGRSSLKTWIFRILTNIAKTRGAREQRSAAFSSVFDDPGPDEPAVDADRFAANGTWLFAPENWGDSPEDTLEVSETNQRVLLHRARSRVRKALEEYFREAGAR